MTIKDFIHSSINELDVTLVSFVELYNSTIQLKFNTSDIRNYEYIMTCDVISWRIENDSSITIWTNNDLLVKLATQLERE